MRRYHFDNCKIITGKNKHKGHPISEETKKKIGFANRISKKGEKKSKEWIELMRSINKGNSYCLGKKLTEDHKEKIRLSHTGKKHSQEFKDAVSSATKGIPKKKIECPYCDKIGSIQNMKRYHFDNCKLNKIN